MPSCFTPPSTAFFCRVLLPLLNAWRSAGVCAALFIRAFNHCTRRVYGQTQRSVDRPTDRLVAIGSAGKHLVGAARQKSGGLSATAAYNSKRTSPPPQAPTLLQITSSQLVKKMQTRDSSGRLQMNKWECVTLGAASLERRVPSVSLPPPKSSYN